jgi:hypothetical protein
MLTPLINFSIVGAQHLTERISPSDTVRSPPHIHQLIDFPSETLRDRTPANSPEPTLLDRAIEPESPKK